MCSTWDVVFMTDRPDWRRRRRREGSLNISPPGGNLSLVQCFLLQFLMFTKTN